MCSQPMLDSIEIIMYISQNDSEDRRTSNDIGDYWLNYN